MRGASLLEHGGRLKGMKFLKKTGLKKAKHNSGRLRGVRLFMGAISAERGPLDYWQNWEDHA